MKQLLFFLAHDDLCFNKQRKLARGVEYTEMDETQSFMPHATAYIYVRGGLVT